MDSYDKEQNSNFFTIETILQKLKIWKLAQWYEGTFCIHMIWLL